MNCNECISFAICRSIVISAIKDNKRPDYYHACIYNVYCNKIRVKCIEIERCLKKPFYLQTLADQIIQTLQIRKSEHDYYE